MKLLLDTHILEWLANSPERLSLAESALLALEDTHILVSAVSIWELRIKWNSFHPSGDRKGNFDPVFAIDFAGHHGFELAPLSPGDCAAPLQPSMSHRDPFDEMLLVHAQQLGARLLTRDRHLADHPVAYRFA